jgi:hypothetical protein
MVVTRQFGTHLHFCLPHFGGKVGAITGDVADPLESGTDFHSDCCWLFLGFLTTLPGPLEEECPTDDMLNLRQIRVCPARMDQTNKCGQQYNSCSTNQDRDQKEILKMMACCHSEVSEPQVAKGRGKRARVHTRAAKEQVDFGVVSCTNNGEREEGGDIRIGRRQIPIGIVVVIVVVVILLDGCDVSHSHTHTLVIIDCAISIMMVVEFCGEFGHSDERGVFIGYQNTPLVSALRRMHNIHSTTITSIMMAII